jgi:hypothetical protein
VVAGGRYLRAGKAGDGPLLLRQPPAGVIVGEDAAGGVGRGRQPADVEEAGADLIVGVGGDLGIGQAEARRLGQHPVEPVIGELRHLAERVGLGGQPPRIVIGEGGGAEIGIGGGDAPAERIPCVAPGVGRRVDDAGDMVEERPRDLGREVDTGRLLHRLDGAAIGVGDYALLTESSRDGHFSIDP